MAELPHTAFLMSRHDIRKSCSYAYKMERLDKDWVNARGMEATYTNLSKGRYTFYLKAANNDGIWNEEPVRLEIRVKPIWYKSTFVEILALLLLTAAIGSLIVWYIRRIKAQKDVEIEQLTKDYEVKVLKNKIESFVDSTYNIKPDDEAFLLSVINHIETNIGNPSFSVEALAEFACCSRGNLHLRIKNITGKSPVELIKIMRMKKPVRCSKTQICPYRTSRSNADTRRTPTSSLSLKIISGKLLENMQPEYGSDNKNSRGVAITATPRYLT